MNVCNKYNGHLSNIYFLPANQPNIAIPRAILLAKKQPNNRRKCTICPLSHPHPFSLGLLIKYRSIHHHVPPNDSMQTKAEQILSRRLKSVKFPLGIFISYSVLKRCLKPGAAQSSCNCRCSDSDNSANGAVSINMSSKPALE